MATTWKEYVHPRSYKGQWMTAGGRVISAPELEQTESGRKVRLKWHTESVFSKDADDLVMAEVRRKVDAVPNDPAWFRLPVGADLAEQHANLRKQRLQAASIPRDSDYNVQPVKLHMTQENVRNTIVFWRYEHPTLPISALVTVDLANYYGSHQLTTRMFTSSLRKDNWFNGQSLIVDHGENVNHYFGYGSEALAEKEPDKASWKHMLDEGKRFDDERAAVVALMRKVRAMNTVTEIHLPDTRWDDVSKHGWLTLSLVETSADDNLMSELNAFLNDQKTIDEITGLYEQMRTKLRKLGLQMPERKKDEFYRVLLGDMTGGVDIFMWQPQAHEIRQGRRSADPGHKVHFNLATGAMAIECTVPHTPDMEEVALEWEKAKMVASLTGEEGELLAYARQYVKDQQAREAKAHMAARHAALSAEDTTENEENS